jgi:hypothetical protein
MTAHRQAIVEDPDVLGNHFPNSRLKRRGFSRSEAEGHPSSRNHREPPPVAVVEGKPPRVALDVHIFLGQGDEDCLWIGSEPPIALPQEFDRPFRDELVPFRLDCRGLESDRGRISMVRPYLSL